MASYFYVAGKKFEVILDQCQPFLFGDKSDLNFICTNKPVKYTYPSASLNSITKVVKCPINIRKDSLKLSKLKDNDNAPAKYNLEFKFDCDIDVIIEIYLFAKERFFNGTLSYTSSTLANGPYFKSQIYKAGSNINFNLTDHYLIPSNYNYSHWQYDHSSQIYPVVIYCTPVNGDASTHSHVTYASLEKINDSDNYTIKLLKQKQIIDGFSYCLQEIYGIEKKTMNRSSISDSDSSVQTSDKKTNEDFNNNNNSSRNNSMNRKNFEKSVKSRRNSAIDVQQGVVECVICMCEKRDTLILPCRHLCLCKSCANNLRGQSSNCPICRIPFNALLQMEILKTRDGFIATDVKETIFEESQNMNSTDIDDRFNGKQIILDKIDDSSLSSNGLSSQENLNSD